MFQLSEQWEGAGRAIPNAVRVLLIVTVAVFIVQFIVDAQTEGMFTLIFGLSRGGLLGGKPWQLLTYVFLHGGLWHILINMLVLVIFGREMEFVLGTRRFLLLYLGGGVLAGIGWILISGSELALCIGASGAVFGVVGAFAAMFPRRPITLLLFFVFPVTTTARTLALVVGCVAFLSLFSGDRSIAHAAHLAGGIAGYLYGKQVLHLQRSGWAALGWGLRRYPRLSSTYRSFFRTEADSPEPDQAEAPTKEEVDRVLDKVSTSGLSSLSARERDVLERASREMAE
jgi:membrane associated rhomboid family serine protease